MSSDDKYRREVEKRLLDLQKIAKDIFEHIELLKLLLADPAPKDSEPISIETPRKTTGISPPNCLHYFGYLRFIPKYNSVPDECLTCQKVIECSKHVE